MVRQVHAGEFEGVITRADLHCHSKASSGPAIRALGLIGVPECYSEPEAVYELARRRGMDLVALTDHDTIEGAMSLVDRGFGGVIVGEEVTTAFPEDGCRLHVLVWGLSPEQHEQIGTLRLREDVYALAAWLHQEQLAHALAHPLYAQNGRLTPWHVDRCALLFKGFEALNGAHSGTHGPVLAEYLDALTPGRVHRLIEAHGFEPRWPRIWEKALTGGSDDHGLLNVGRAFTVVHAAEPIADPREFLRLVMSGRSRPEGVAGHSSLLAHQLATVGAHYAARRLVPRASPKGRYLASKLLRFAGVDVPAPSRVALLAQHARDVVRRRVLRRGRRLDPLAQALRECFGPVAAQYGDLTARLDPAGRRDGPAIAEHERMAAFVHDLHAAMHRAMGSGTLRALKARDGTAIIDHLASAAILELSQLPYIFSLFHQNKEREFLATLRQHVAAGDAPGLGHARRASSEPPMKVMLFTDTLGDVNGVSRFIRNAAAQARATGRELRVVTSTRLVVPDEPNIVNVEPIFACPMPRYENLELVLPPVARLLAQADAFQPDVIHVSTPGPVGAVGVLAARMLRCPLVGVYHTDFPAYIDHLWQDESLTYLTSRTMSAFYGPFRAIFTRSQDYVSSLLELGVARERIVPLKPGIMVREFQPSFRDPSIWTQLGGESSGTVRVLSCGRVSVEKNLPLLVKVWKRADARLRAMGVAAELVVVGDGPYREEMERELRGTRVRFLGFRHGKELSAIYASSDFFVFPSVTDTLGQVVMEAQSSGLPVVVTSKGGPKEMVNHGVTGYVVDDDDVDSWVDTVIQLTVNSAARSTMGQAAHVAMQPLSMEASFEHYWQVHEEVRRAWLESRSHGSASRPKAGGRGFEIRAASHEAPLQQR